MLDVIPNPVLLLRPQPICLSRLRGQGRGYTRRECYRGDPA